MANEWEKNGQRHKQRHGVWKRVRKKCCCLAEKDITSDTNVKLASSGTVRPLFSRWCGVSVWLSPSSLHPWTLLYYAYPSLVLPIHLSFQLSPSFLSCINSPLNFSIIPILSFSLSVLNIFQYLILFVFFSLDEAIVANPVSQTYLMFFHFPVALNLQKKIETKYTIND